LITNTPTH
jgi:hypothetical protein